ncbi:MAG: hypothetical protein ABSF55_02825, partial [Candidatus Staskawiczbacteria bacterium]
MSKTFHKSFVLIFAAVFVMCGFFVVAGTVSAAITSSQGPNNGSTFADNATVGTLTWSNPSNAQTSNDVYAVATSAGPGPQPTHYLKATNFGFSIPTGATINGIEVKVERDTTSTSVKDNGVYLVKNTGLTGTDHSITSSSASGFTSCSSPATGTGCWLQNTETIVTYGSSTDLWGTTWTPSDINNTATGIVFSASRTAGSNSRTISVDNINIKVYYTINTYTLTYTAGDNGSITGDSPQTVNSGADGTAVTAVPADGYHFTSWSDDSTQNPRT